MADTKRLGRQQIRECRCEPYASLKYRQMPIKWIISVSAATGVTTGHLLRREVDLDVVLELMLAWNRSHCRPPLPDDEVARVVHSIARVHERGASESP